MKRHIQTLLLCFIVSTLHAQTWTKLNLPETGKSIITLKKGSDGNLYALTDQGLFKSTDDAENWTLVSRDATGTKLLTVDQNGTAFTDNTQIINKTKNGETTFGVDYNQLTNPNTAEMETLSDGTLIQLDYKAFRVSSDGGTTFTKIDKHTNFNRNTNRNLSILFSNENDDVYYLGSDKNIYHSTDKGQTFTASGSKINFTNGFQPALAIDRKTGHFYAIVNGGGFVKSLLKSSDHGKTWTTAIADQVYGTAVEAYDDQIVVYGPTYLHYSSDGGATWTDHLNMFTLGDLPISIRISATGNIFGQNVRENAIVKIDFSNNTWTRKTKGLDYTRAIGISTNGSRIAATLSGYVHYTDDEGKTWTALKGEGAESIGNWDNSSPANPSIYVAKNGTVYVAQHNIGTWSGIYVQDANDSMVKAKVDAGEMINMNSMFEDDKGNIYGLSFLNNGLFVSSNGVDFTQMPDVPKANLEKQVMWFSESNKRIYSILTTPQTIHYSDDYGKTWVEGTPVEGLSWPNYQHFKGDNKMWVYVWTTTQGKTGFYHSTDLKTWSGPHITSKNFDGRWDQYATGKQTESLYVASSSANANFRNIIQSNDTGKTWTRFETGLDSVKWFDFRGTMTYRIPVITFRKQSGKLLLTTRGSIYINDIGNNTTKSISNTDKLNYIIYPNPASNSITIKTDDVIEKISIFNAQGQLINLQSSPQKTVDVSSLTSGLYTVIVQTKAGVSNSNIVIQH